MRVQVTLDLTDAMRAAIQHHYGRPGLASRAECASTIRHLVEADLDVILAEYQQSLRDS